MFDEVGDIEDDPSYALLWEVAMQAQSKYKLVLVAASATISIRLAGCFTRLGAAVICCPERQFLVRNFTISIPASCEIWMAIIHITASLFKRGNVCLVFLRGKYEIDAVQKGLEEAGVGKKCIFHLHGDMDEDSIDTTKKSTGFPRCILSTSKGEKAVTIVDVDHVIDSGFERTAVDDKEDRDMIDTRSTLATTVQRAGRVGRIKDGTYIKVVPLDCPDPADCKTCSLDSVMQVLALQTFHLRIGIQDCKLCECTDDVVFLALRRLKDLNFVDEQLLTALTKNPLPLKDAAVLHKAMQYGPVVVALLT